MSERAATGRKWGIGVAAAAIVLSAGWALLACQPGDPATPDPTTETPVDRPRPHVLLVSIDTLRADHSSSYGYKRQTTPTIDVLARSGVLFEQAYSHSPKTAPSHMSLMTSLYPEEHGVRQLSHKEARRLKDSIPTLATILQRNGYRTAAITAGGNASAKLGFDQGMNSFQTMHDIAQSVKLAAVQLSSMQGVVPEREPLFLFLHTYEVHDPYTPRLPYRELYTDPDYAGGIVSDMRKIAQTTDDIFQVTHKYFWERVDGTDPADLQHLQDLYDGSIRRVDTELAKLFKWLREQDLMQETLVVILSDHGEEFLDHGGYLHTRVYQEVLHIPLIIIFPRNDPDRPRNKRIAAPVRLVDVMPTLLDYLDIEAPGPVQGQSLLPLVRGTGEGPPARIVSSYTRRGYTALRENGWKMIQHVRRRLAGPGFVTTRELYDLNSDPAERQNLSKEQPERLSALADLSRKLHDEARAVYKATPPGPLIDSDEQTTEELRALGYVE